MDNTNWILDNRIIAIIRGDYSQHIISLTDALYIGGIRIAEITMNSPDAVAMITLLRSHYHGKMWIGDGTVVTTEQVALVAESGAQFIVSPDTFPDVIQKAISLDMEAIPGAFTPSEVRTAVRAGANFVKLFPAMPAGSSHLQQMLEPMSDVPFVATGGIGLSEIEHFMQAGATAFGIGSALVPKEFRGTQSEIELVKVTATNFCAEVMRHR